MRKLAVVSAILCAIFATIVFAKVIFWQSSIPPLSPQSASNGPLAPDAISSINQGKLFLEAHDILAARDEFAAAVNADPANQEANFLYGVTRVFAVVDEGQSLNTDGLDSFKEILELAGATVGSLSIYGSDITMPGEFAATTPRTGKILDFIKTRMLPEISGAIANLDKVTDTSFASVLSSASIAGASSTSLSADYADALTIKALLSVLKCNLNLLKVYGLDVSIPDIQASPDQLMTYKQLLNNDPTLLTPIDAASLTESKSALLTFIDTFSVAVKALKSRSIANGHLFVIDLSMPDALANVPSSFTDEFQKALADIKASLSGPAYYSFTRSSSPAAVVDLSKFFNAAAPINLREMTVDCNNSVIIPDNTFGGVFPLGLTELQSSLLSEKVVFLGTACGSSGSPLINLNSDSSYFYSPGDSGLFTISNSGTAPLSASFSLKSQNAADFQLAKESCSSLTPTLTAGDSCSVRVTFNPTGSGSRTALLDISSNDPGKPHIYASLNSYVSYQPIDGTAGQQINAIAADPATPATIYSATNNGLSKSTDAGLTWSAVAGLPAGSVTTIMTTAANTIYATTINGIYKSTTGGGAWTLLNQSPSNVNVLAMSAGTLLASNSGTVYRTNNDGTSWLNSSLPNFYSVASLAADSTNPGTVYAGSWNGIYKSIDYGATWSTLTGTPKSSYNGSALSIQMLRATTSGIFAGTYEGLFKSTDGGSSWTPVNLNSNGYQPGISSFIVSPFSSTTYFVSDGWTIYKSTNGGISWNSFINGGIGNSISQLAIADASSVLAGSYSGIYRIPEAGQSKTYKLTATFAGTGTGVITPYLMNQYYGGNSQVAVGPRNCTSSTCEWTIQEGTSLGFNENPGTSSIFSGWSGCDKFSGTECLVTMIADKNVTVKFDADARPFSLAAYPAAGAYSSPISVVLIQNKNLPIRYTLDGTVPTENSLLYENPIDISADTVLKFTGIDISGATPVQTASYTFSPAFTLTVTLEGNGGGTITSNIQGTNPSGISCLSGTCTTTFPANQNVSLLKLANAVSSFEKWGGNCTGTDACSVTMTADMAVIASFILTPKAMNVSANNTPYSSIFTALFEASSGQEIYLLDTQFDGGPFILTKGLTLRGGRNTLFNGWSGNQTVLNGGLNATSGASTLETIDVLGRINVQGGSLKVKSVRVK